VLQHTARRQEGGQAREAAAEAGSAGREPPPLRDAREAPTRIELVFDSAPESGRCLNGPQAHTPDADPLPWLRSVPLPR
jgi:hypothetical protein